MLLDVAGELSKDDNRERLMVYRGTERTSEIDVFNETGLIMSDASRQAYLTARGEGQSVTNAGSLAIGAGIHRHMELLEIYGGESAMAREQTLTGSNFPNSPRSMFSVTTDLQRAIYFSGDNGQVFQSFVPKDMLIRTPVSGSESEYFIRNMYPFRRTEN